jgi:hypothetical protein
MGSGGVVVLALFLLWWQLDIGQSVVSYPQPNNSVLAEFRARVFWAVSSATFAALIAWNTAVSIVVLRTYSRSNRSLYISVAVIIAAILVSFVAYWDPGGKSVELVNKVILMNPMGSLDLSRPALKFVGAIGVALVMTAACALAAAEFGETRDPKALARQVRDTRLCFYSACALLVAAVAQVYFTYSWPASIVATSSALYHQLATTVALAAGCVFSLLLLSVFVPVWLIQSGWIAAAADAAGRSADWKREEWLKQFDLEESTFSVLGRAVSTLLPVVLGLLLEYAR